MLKFQRDILAGIRKNKLISCGGLRKGEKGKAYELYENKEGEFFFLILELDNGLEVQDFKIYKEAQRTE